MGRVEKMYLHWEGGAKEAHHYSHVIRVHILPEAIHHHDQHPVLVVVILVTTILVKVVPKVDFPQVWVLVVGSL